jgi:hypothetical protein
LEKGLVGETPEREEPEMAAKTLDVDQAKALAYQTLSEDGLVDLFCALGLILVGLGWLYGLVALSAAGPPAMVALWLAARARLSKPRMGSVALREDTQLRLSRGLLLLGVIGAMVFGLFVYFATVATDSPNRTLQDFVPALPTLIVAVMALIGWGLLRANRFLLYALGLLVAGAIVIALDAEPYVGFFIGAALPLVFGTLTLANFLRNNPVIDA